MAAAEYCASFSACADSIRTGSGDGRNAVAGSIPYGLLQAFGRGVGQLPYHIIHRHHIIFVCTKIFKYENKLSRIALQRFSVMEGKG